MWEIYLTKFKFYAIINKTIERRIIMEIVRDLVSHLTEAEVLNGIKEETLVGEPTLERVFDRVKPYLLAIFNSPVSVDEILKCRTVQNLGSNLIVESLCSSDLSYTLHVTTSGIELTWSKDSSITFEAFIVSSLAFACAISGYTAEGVYMSVRATIDDYINHKTDENFSISQRAGEYLFSFGYSRGNYTIEVFKNKSTPDEKDLKKYLRALHKAVFLNPVDRLRKYAPQLEFDESCLSSRISSYDFEYWVKLPCGMLAFFGNRTKAGYLVNYVSFTASTDSKKRGHEVFLGMLHGILTTKFSCTKCLENRDYDGMVVYKWGFWE